MRTFIVYSGHPNIPNGWPCRDVPPETPDAITESDAEYAQRIASLQPAYDAMQKAVEQAKVDSSTAQVAAVNSQFETIAVAFDERQKRLDELLAKPDVESLTKAVTILLGDTAQMTKLLLSFKEQFVAMATKDLG